MAGDDRKGVRAVGAAFAEPAMEESEFYRSRVVNDLEAFKRESDVIVANRMAPELEDVAEKVYSRDLFGGDS